MKKRKNVVDRALNRVRERGAKAGLASNPCTPLSVVDEVLERIASVLLKRLSNK